VNVETVLGEQQSGRVEHALAVAPSVGATRDHGGWRWDALVGCDRDVYFLSRRSSYP
jgi:hypothetical protein